MKHTRITALALALALSLGLLSGCGNNAQQPGSNSTPDASTSTPDASTPDASAPDTSEPDISMPDASTPEAPLPSDPIMPVPDTSQPEASDPEPEPVEPAQPVLTLNKTDFTLFSAGATYRLRYRCEPDYDAIGEFSSSNEEVATVAEDGTVTAVAPGTATITLKYADLTAKCIVRCKWEETDTPASGDGKDEDSSTPAPAGVDLSAFYSTIHSTYEMPSMESISGDILDNFYSGLSDISTAQCLVYVPMMTSVASEIALIQVNSSGDVSAVKSILQARIDAQASGGAWYPQTVENWKNNSRIAANGNYILMVVSPSCDSIVSDFNALF